MKSHSCTATVIYDMRLSMLFTTCMPDTVFTRDDHLCVMCPNKCKCTWCVVCAFMLFSIQLNIVRCVGCTIFMPHILSGVSSI